MAVTVRLPTVLRAAYALAAAVAEDLLPGDVCVVMGAGSIGGAAREILALLGARAGRGEEAA